MAKTKAEEKEEREELEERLAEIESCLATERDPVAIMRLDSEAQEIRKQLGISLVNHPRVVPY